MDSDLRLRLETIEGKQLYGYQEAAIDRLMQRIALFPERHNVLFQLPTGSVTS